MSGFSLPKTIESVKLLAPDVLLQVFEKNGKSMQKGSSKVVLFGPRSVQGRPRLDCDTFPVDFGRRQKFYVF